MYFTSQFQLPVYVHHRPCVYGCVCKWSLYWEFKSLMGMSMKLLQNLVVLLLTLQYLPSKFSSEKHPWCGCFVPMSEKERRGGRRSTVATPHRDAVSRDTLYGAPGKLVGKGGGSSQSLPKVVENEPPKILWDFQIQNGWCRMVANQLDIVVSNKQQKMEVVIDASNPKWWQHQEKWTQEA